MMSVGTINKQKIRRGKKVKKKRVRMRMMIQKMTMKTCLTINMKVITQYTLGKVSIRLYFREILDSKYIILSKLGWGHFSTVWLALCLSDKKLYALKI